MSHVVRPYIFPVRPGHRETVASYTSRVLERNFETQQHWNQLLTQLNGKLTVANRDSAWLALLADKTKRDSLHLSAHPTAWLTHIDGDGCDMCAENLPERWMCTRCAKGARVKQNPHFDNLVCQKHRRWVGLEVPPEQQVQLGDGPEGDVMLKAATRFEKLRRAHLLDVRLFLLLEDTIAETAVASSGNPASTSAFLAVISTVWAITRPAFTQQFFSPAHSFAESFECLSSELRHLFGTEQPELARAVWLYSRPTFWSIRHSLITQTLFTPTWPHDFPLATNIARAFEAPADKMEPFTNFLLASGDDSVTVAQFGAGTHSKRVAPATAPRIKSNTELSICSAGHQFESSASRQPAKAGSATLCPVCDNRIIQPGYNDLATTHPNVAAQLDITLNNGLTATQIAASSRQTLQWRCPVGHSFTASVSNRTAAKSSCPICLNRVIVPGVNDVATTHPEVVALWDPSWLAIARPTKMSAGSNRMVYFICATERHSYQIRLVEATNGKGCPVCGRKKNRTADSNLSTTHPSLAEEWHPTYNHGLEPSDFTHGSKEKAVWLCPVGHHYVARIERRVAGYKCSVCSRRTLVPGVNDLSTTQPLLVTEFHPYLNGMKGPDRIFAGTDLYWWRCIRNNHKYQQSVPHRVNSKGCPMCPPEERLLAS